MQLGPLLPRQDPFNPSLLQNREEEDLEHPQALACYICEEGMCAGRASKLDAAAQLRGELLLFLGSSSLVLHRQEQLELGRELVF